MDPKVVPPETVGGSPYGGWVTIGLGLLVGAVFTVLQILVVIVHVVASHASDSGRGFEELLAEAPYNGLVIAIATCTTTLVCTGLVVWLVSNRRGIAVGDYLALKGIPFKRLVPWALGVLALVFLSDWITKMTDRPIVPEVILDIYRTAGFAPLLWFAVVVAAPIFEEIFFRGFLFKGFHHSRSGAMGAILLTSLLWAAIHMQYDLWNLGIIFLLGVFLGFARLRTGSVYATIALHSLVNLIATIETVAVISRETVGIGV